MTAWGMLFPLTVSKWGAATQFNTSIIVGNNGQEVRNANWQDPLRKFNAAFHVRTYEDISTLLSFFNAVRGREQSFLVKDWSDFESARTTIGTGDGVTQNFQLVKTYINAVAGNYTRTITKPKQVEGVGGVRVWVNNVELATSAFSFSSTTGIINIPSAPTAGHAVEASCDEFYVPCRFDVDELPVDIMMYAVERKLVEIPDIPLCEVRGE